jgi:hypothetical protein
MVAWLILRREILPRQPGDLGGGPRGVRFAAIGDTGKGNTGQKQVADAIARKCAASGCDFVQLLGDNIYDSGVTSVTDPQWQTKFEHSVHGRESAVLRRPRQP